MKVIFLDNDGVICLSSNWGGRSKKWAKYRSANPETSKQLSDAPVEVRFDDFDKKAVKILNEVLVETGAEVVISSDWKLHGSLEDLGQFYDLMGVVKKPIDFTPIVNQSGTLELLRSLEIQKWLENNKNVTSWVSVDDLDMSLFLGDNFVLTPKESEGIKQTGVKEKLIKILNYKH
jgi:hypothetical protein